MILLYKQVPLPRRGIGMTAKSDNGLPITVEAAAFRASGEFNEPWR